MHICSYFGSPHEETSGYDDPSIASSVSEKDFQMVPSSPSLKRLCSSAERAWLGGKQHTHAPFNSASEPSVLKLPLEDDPSQFDNNWTLFSAPQEGIKWESGDPFLQRNGEQGSERHLNVDSGYGSVTLGLQEGIHTWSSSQGRGGLPVWEHHSCEDLSHLEEGEGESTLLQPSRNTDQVHPTFVCIVLTPVASQVFVNMYMVGCVYMSRCCQRIIVCVSLCWICVHVEYTCFTHITHLYDDV